MEFEKTGLINNWDSWKSTLGKAVDLGELVGMSQESIEKVAVKIGSMLSVSVDPENREQRLLQELWKLGDDGDRKALAKMIVKMVQTEKH